MNHKRYRNSDKSLPYWKNDKIAEMTEQNSKSSANISQITPLHQSLWFWLQHSRWSYFNRGLFWGGLVSSISVFSAIGGMALTTIDVVEQQISRQLKGNSQAIAQAELQLDTDISIPEIISVANVIKELEPDRLTVELLSEDTSIAAKETRDRPIDNNLEQTLRSTIKSDRVAKNSSLQNRPIAVQNTTDDPELGRRVVAYLRARNFGDVYLVRHIPLKLEQTKIVTDYGQVETANYLKNILGFGDLEAGSSQRQQLILQLGEDALYLP